MAYVDGFILPVPEGNLGAYRKDAKIAAKVWLEHGALQYCEAVADDVPVGKSTDFHKAVKRKDGETVIFSFATYKNRKHRDEVMKKVMADPRMKMDPTAMAFDGRRMFWGGFKTFIDVTAKE
ncbi:MAG: RNA signal recognition particle [Alphaproteobacteria bacterium 32-64-14]|nr:MAG: RNA signal recognition particle [Alphaproteobacteria bacterium 32-64-14]